jgi:hypothetical protein
MGGILPVWTGEWTEPRSDDPIGCPVGSDEMVRYLNPLLTFEVTPSRLEFLQGGALKDSRFWLWGFYGEDGNRWNLIVFAEGCSGCRSTKRLWMCADNNPHGLNDDAYIVAIHNKEY